MTWRLNVQLCHSKRRRSTWIKISIDKVVFRSVFFVVFSWLFFCCFLPIRKWMSSTRTTSSFFVALLARRERRKDATNELCAIGSKTNLFFFFSLPFSLCARFNAFCLNRIELAKFHFRSFVLSVLRFSFRRRFFFLFQFFALRFSSFAFDDVSAARFQHKIQLESHAIALLFHRSSDRLCAVVCKWATGEWWISVGDSKNHAFNHFDVNETKKLSRESHFDRSKFTISVFTLFSWRYTRVADALKHNTEIEFLIYFSSAFLTHCLNQTVYSSSTEWKTERKESEKCWLAILINSANYK